MTANEPARDVVTARAEHAPEADGMPALVPIEEGRYYPTEAEVAADGSGGIRDLALSDAAVEHGVRNGMVTISFGSDALDPRSYEFDVTPDNAWRIAMKLIAVVAVVEPEARR
jgi:hypothetical protein